MPKGFFSPTKICVRSVVLIGVILITLASFAFSQEEAYEKAVNAYLKKDYKKAVEYLKEYVARKPDAGAYYLLGYASYKLKNRAEASEFFREAYLIDPEFSPRSLDFRTVRK